MGRGPVPAARRTDPGEVFAAIDKLKAEHPGQDWFAQLTGHPINGSAWEKRFERARQRGWMDGLHVEEFLGLVRKATQEGQERPSEPRTARGRVSVPRLPSEPLRRALDSYRREVMTGRRRHGSRQLRIRPAREVLTTDDLTIYEADRMCVRRLGVHPALVYGDDWWRAVGEAA